MLTEIFENLNIEQYARKGFCISFIGTDSEGTDVYQAQRIDETNAWEREHGYDFKIPNLSTDELAKEVAITEGFEFNDVNDPLRVTGKK